MVNTRTKRTDRLLKLLSSRAVAVVTHDNPDPDAIASGWAILTLLRAVNGQSARLIGRGAIVRAENLHMMRTLKPPLEFVTEFPDHDTAVVLVDCVPTGGNHLLSGMPIRPVAVIDHHDPRGNRFRVAYRDVRPAAATATITAGYLRDQGITPETPLATALLFAMRTELTGQQRSLTRTDRGTIAWLSGLADYGLVAEIEDAPLSREYFQDLLLALQNVFTYDDAGICMLPQVAGAEIVGEVADLLIRCEGIHRVLCAATVANNLVLSARTTLKDGDAVALLGSTLRGLGHWGGHEHRAGGRVPALDARQQTPESLFGVIKERWLAACKVDQQRGSRLVRRQAIIDHL